MEHLEIMRRWLMAFPGLEQITVDGVDAIPGSCGLFPRGYQQEGTAEDILGNRTVGCRLSFLLRREAVPGEDAAAWLLELQQWAEQTPPPALGEDTRIVAQKGSMVRSSQTGTGTYEVTLTAYFNKHDEGE